MSTEQLDGLPWLERLNKSIDQASASGDPGFSLGYLFSALVRGLQEKGVLSVDERDGLFAAWDRLDELNRQAAERERQALLEQHPELVSAILPLSPRAP